MSDERETHGRATTPRLIASVSAGALDGVLERARTGTDGADLVEIRLDGLRTFSLEAIREAVDKPLVATCRSVSQGGMGSPSRSERDRLALLAEAARSGFEMVDVEIDAVTESFDKADAALVLSHHDFDGVPDDGDALVERALDLGADVVKLAAQVDSIEDVLELARLGGPVRVAGKAFVPVPMGPAGIAGRILAVRWRAAFAYAAARGGEPTGPGQLTLDDLLGRYRFRSLEADTAVYGLVGAHASSSLSPAMHNYGFGAAGFDAIYVPFEEHDLERFVRAAKQLGVSGLSITHPYKEAIVPYLDALDSRAEALGAVNTVTVDPEGNWLGSNTDVDGVLEPLKSRGEWRSKRALIVGAGGAARAAAHALDELHADVVVAARDATRAASVAGLAGGTAVSLDELDNLERRDGAGWDLVVNATPLGMNGETVPVGTLSATTTVFDMVSVPESTPLIRRARDGGASVITGVHMLAAQAVRQQERWTGGRLGAVELERVARHSRDGGRYSRQVLFQPIGDGGQALIRDAKVLVVGVGALGSVSSEMMVRAGVRRLTVVDRDYVDQSNLQRQSLFEESDWREGLPKAIAAERKLSRINSDVEVVAHVADVHAGNIGAMMKDVDLVLDGTDNFETRYLLNDASIETETPWIYAACVGSYGMSFVVIPGETPCLRCFMEDEPAPGTSPTCDTAGVIAPIVHAVASFQVAEALKLLSARRDALHGEMLSIDVWQGRVDKFRPSEPRESCPACGLRELSYLAGDASSHAVTLCGRNAVQVRPARTQTLELDEVASRLSKLGEVSLNPFLLRVKLDAVEIVLFKDGRAIVHGTADTSEARSMYARYVGS